MKCLSFKKFAFILSLAPFLLITAASLNAHGTARMEGHPAERHNVDNRALDRGVENRAVYNRGVQAGAVEGAAVNGGGGVVNQPYYPSDQPQVQYVVPPPPAK